MPNILFYDNAHLQKYIKYIKKNSIYRNLHCKINANISSVKCFHFTNIKYLLMKLHKYAYYDIYEIL